MRKTVYACMLSYTAVGERETDRQAERDTERDTERQRRSKHWATVNKFQFLVSAGH